MVAPSVDELLDFTGRPVDAAQAEAVLDVVTALARAYTRGQGFTAGEPNADVGAVILSASARLLTNPTGVASESMGPFATQYAQYGGAGFSWTVTEKYALDRYRVKAQ